MSKIIEIIFDPTGKIRLETKGFQGSICLDASRFLEKVLGDKQVENMTSEFHESKSQVLNKAGEENNNLL